MAKSALQREIEEGIRKFDEKRNPNAKREAKARRRNSSENKRSRNIVRGLTTVEVLEVLLERERKAERNRASVIRVQAWRAKKKRENSVTP